MGKTGRSNQIYTEEFKKRQYTKKDTKVIKQCQKSWAFEAQPT
ncbi:hypothetical protein [Mesobacillus foraminis]|uniref:Uncharacterized protein n=1 Tax=Mesobacillus foraminis TaxID=279826 RepID=A0A4R2B6K5_9BACI|nr:hypothetical protein [Mesobacillus foraminis]TCN22206.1 hypothetical protein EV146_11143 [Mesobacillus foraminis]